MDARLCAWWSHRQGLDGSLAGLSPAEVLARTGWARSVGGVAPYLTLFARAGIGRADVDQELAKVHIQELPSARGCTYVVPAAHYGLALHVGRPFSKNELAVAHKLGVTDAEIDTLREAILKALSEGPLNPEQLRSRTGDAARNLGPEGTQNGLTTTLPVALGLLQSAGRIRRVPLNGRLDRQRYRYELWDAREDGSFTELARWYFSWIGPATIDEFRMFAGLSGKAARAAVEPLNMTMVDGLRFLLAEDRGGFEKFRIPANPHYVLVSSLDDISHLRRDVKSLLTPEDCRLEFFRGKNALADLPGHAILDRGRVVGLWEFDADRGAIVWVSFIGRDRAMSDAVHRMETFVSEDLGDARAFGLDSPARRGPRIEALRKAAGA